MSAPTELSHRVTQNVRRLRRARKWSLRELSERLGEHGCPISQMTLGRRERGDGKRDDVSVDELYAFAAVFALPVPDLVEGDTSCGRCRGVPPAGLRCLLCGTENRSRTERTRSA